VVGNGSSMQKHVGSTGNSPVILRGIFYDICRRNVPGTGRGPQVLTKNNKSLKKTFYANSTA